jgi:hypothetical protein
MELPAALMHPSHPCSPDPAFPGMTDSSATSKLLTWAATIDA